MDNNFGLRSRDMRKAGRFALDRAAGLGEMADGTVVKHAGNFTRFIERFVYPLGLRRLEHIDRDHLIKYGCLVREEVEREDFSVQTGHGRVCSINTVMDLATHGEWVSVGAVRDCKMRKRDFLRRVVPGALEQVEAERVIDAALAADPYAGPLPGLARALGLRGREACLFDSRNGLKEALTHGRVTIERGAKGGRKRQIPITSAWQLEVLELSAAVQGSRPCLIHPDMNYVEFLNGPVRSVREVVQEFGIAGYHELRASFACEFYEKEAKFPAPCATGQKPLDKAIDLAARKKLSPVLGHRRVEIVGAYVGGR